MTLAHGLLGYGVLALLLAGLWWFWRGCRRTAGPDDLSDATWSPVTFQHGPTLTALIDETVAKIEADDYPEATCHVCDGIGDVHDCGEDACCCADPGETDLVPCGNCGGTGMV